MLSSLIVGSLLLMSAVMADPEGHRHRKHRKHCKKGRCCFPPPFFPPPFPPIGGGIEAGFVARPGFPGNVPLTPRQQQFQQRQQQPIRRQVRPIPTRTLRFTTTIRTTVPTPFITTVFAPAAPPAPGYPAPAPSPCVCVCGAVGETKVGSGQIVFQCQQQQAGQAGPGGCPMCPQQAQQNGKVAMAPPGQAKVEPGISPCPTFDQKIIEAQREQIQDLQQAAAEQGQFPRQPAGPMGPGQKQMGRYPYGYPYPGQYPGKKGRAGRYPAYPPAKELQLQQGYYGQQQHPGAPGQGGQGAPVGYYQQGGQGAPGGYWQQGGQGGVGAQWQGGTPGDYYGQGGQWQGYYGDTQPTPCTTTATETTDSTSCTTTTTETETDEDSETESTSTTSTGDSGSDADSDLTAKSNWAAEQSGPSLGLLASLMVASFALITIM